MNTSRRQARRTNVLIIFVSVAAVTATVWFAPPKDTSQPTKHSYTVTERQIMSDPRIRHAKVTNNTVFYIVTGIEHGTTVDEETCTAAVLFEKGHAKIDTNTKRCQRVG